MSAAPHVSDDQIAAVLELMGDEALTLKQSCDKSDLSYGNVRRRIGLSEDLKALYARAREDYAVAKVELMAEIADKEPDVARARLKCDNIKWEAAKVLPKLYGDKIEHEHKGQVSIVATSQDERI